MVILNNYLNERLNMHLNGGLTIHFPVCAHLDVVDIGDPTVVIDGGAWALLRRWGGTRSVRTKSRESRP